MKITIEIDDADFKDINEAIRLANRAKVMEATGTHGRLTPEILAQMLLEDVALSVRRPGSWEAVSVAQLLYSHGYEI